VKRSAWQRIADCFFGYDFFVSYTWKDGATYAFRLAKALEQRGFDCFLDSQSYVKGDDWKIVGAAAIRRTSKLVLVGSPGVWHSTSVLREIQIFTASGRRIVPIDFDGSLEAANIRDHPLARFISPALLKIKEKGQCLQEGPSDTTLADLQNSFANIRQSAKRTRALKAIAATLAIFLAFAIGFWRLAERRRSEADVAKQDALTKRDEATAAKKVAEVARQDAKSSQEVAEQQRNVAITRQLVAVSNQTRLEEPQRLELAALLAIQSIQMKESPEANNALREAMGKLLRPIRTTPFLAKLNQMIVHREQGLLLNADGKHLWLYDAISGKTTVLANSAKIRSAALLDDGKLAVLCSSDSHLTIVGANGLQKLEAKCDAVLGAQDLFVSLTHDNLVVYNLRGENQATIHRNRRQVSLSQDGKFLTLWEGDRIEVWRTNDAQEVELNGAAHTTITSVVFSPNSKLVAIGDRAGVVSVVRVADGAEVFYGLCHTELITALAISKDGEHLLTGGGDGAVREWTIPQKGKDPPHPADADFVVWTGAYPNDVAFGPRSTMIAGAGRDGVVFFVDREEPQDVRYAIHPPGTGVSELVFAGADGRHLLSVDNRGVVRHWSIGNAGGRVSLTIGGPVKEVRISPDGRYMAAYGFFDEKFGNNEETEEMIAPNDFNKTIFLWDLSGPLLPKALSVEGDFVEELGFSSDSKYLSANREGNNPSCWRVSDGKVVYEDDIAPPKPGHNARISPVAYATKKRRGCQSAMTPPVVPPTDGRFRVRRSKVDPAALEVEDRAAQTIAILRSDLPIKESTPSPDGNYVAITSGRLVIVWRLSDRQKVGWMTHDASVTSVVFHPMAPWLASGSEDGSIRFWSFDTPTLVWDACQLLHHNLTEAEWNQYIAGAEPYRKVCPALP
jgi:WD40 repeat protein